MENLLLYQLEGAQLRHESVKSEFWFAVGDIYSADHDRKVERAKRAQDLSRNAVLVAIRRFNQFLTEGTFPPEFILGAGPAEGGTAKPLPAPDEGLTPFVVVLADAPRFTIIDASDRYLRGVGRSLGELLGHGLFSVFERDYPGHRPALDRLRASFSQAMADKGPDTIRGTRRSAVPSEAEDMEAQDGGFEGRYGPPLSLALRGSDGDVRFIVHHPGDVAGTAGYYRKVF